MTEEFTLYKKLAENVEDKLCNVLAVAEKQLEIAENDDMDSLVQLTDKRGKLIDEANLIAEEMNGLENKLVDCNGFRSFKNQHISLISSLKGDIRELNDKVIEAITQKMTECRDEIRNVSESKEALRSYGNQDYPFESTYFDKRN